MSHFIISSSSRHHLRDAERAGQHAVRAGDAARLERRLHDAVLGLLDGVGRADLGAGGVVAVHADRRARWRCVLRRSMKSTWIIGLPRWVSHSAQAFDAGLAADAARGIDVELVAEHQRPSAVEAPATDAPSARSRAHRRPRPSQAAGRDLVLGDLAARVERAVGEAVGAAPPGQW